MMASQNIKHHLVVVIKMNIQQQPTYALENIVKALSLPFSQFFNTTEDWARLTQAKAELNRRKSNDS